MRDHIKKAPPRSEPFDLNEAIDEVIEMVQSAIDKEWSLGPHPPERGCSPFGAIVFNCNRSS